MRPRILLSLLLVAVPLVAAPRRRAIDLPHIPVAGIEAAVASQRSLGLPGMSVAIGRGNAILFAGAYGVTNRETAAATRVDSIFQIGSVSKQFAAAAIMRLEERGALSVSDPVERWIPELAGRNITIEHLLNHTSGLAPETAFLEDPFEPWTIEQLIAGVSSIRQEFPAGTRYAYRNTGYYMLAAIVERASGRRYAQFLDEELFTPLGLTSTAVCGSKPTVPTPDGYGVVRATREVVPLPAAHMSILVGAGDICSTATDLIRWNRALTTGLAVSRTSYERMATPSRIPTFAGFRYGYGLVLQLDRGNPMVLHDGLVRGFQSVLIYYPEHDLTIAVLANAIQDDLAWVPATEVGLEIGRLFVGAR